jgi:hypothetical protein
MRAIVKRNGSQDNLLKTISMDFMGITQIEPADRVRELLIEVKKRLVVEREPN